MTLTERINLERALEQLDEAKETVAEVARSAAIAPAPLAQGAGGLEQATREV